MSEWQEIYADGEYKISGCGARARITHGKNKTFIPLRDPGEMPQKIKNKISAAGHKPQDYFFVGTLTHGAAIRMAALEQWSEACEKRKKQSAANTKERIQEEARALESARYAIIFYGSYLLETALIRVRPATQEERGKYAPEWRERLFFPVGSWSTIDRSVVEAFLKGRNSDGHIHNPSALFFVEKEQWMSFLIDEKKRVAEVRDAKKQLAKRLDAKRKATIAEAILEAKKQGRPIEISRTMDECDGSAIDCSFDLIREMVDENGTLSIERTHCH